MRGPVRLAQMALACVCTTALGLLVVPEVNMIPNGSIGSTARPAHASASSANRSAKATTSATGASASTGSVTAIQRRSAPASATRAANSGWVMAATHCALSTK